VPGCRTAMIPEGSHWMFDQAPEKFCEIVLGFLAA
jgi:pimeloyl-ACP methyl ester carboxylesterase